MKIIEVDEELYQYIASNTQSIGESASDILRRLLNLPSTNISSLAFDFADKTEVAQNVTQNVTQKVEQKADAVHQEKQKAEQKSDPKAEQTAVQIPDLFEQHIEQHIEQNSFSENTDLIETLLNSDDFKQEQKAVVRFLSILTALYQTNSVAFANAIRSENVQGRTRLYFAEDQQTLLEVGNHTKPKIIPNSPYWVITNNNSGRKMIMLESVMREMALPHALIENVKNAFVGN